MDFYKAITRLREKRKLVQAAGKIESDRLILNKSIVFEFYIKGHKTFQSLKTNF
jgi:hypothetical protein